MTTFEEIREKHLEQAKDVGQNILSDTYDDLLYDNELSLSPKNIATTLPYTAAVESSLYGMNVAAELREAAETDVDREAAELIGYEMTEKARKALISELEVQDPVTEEYLDPTSRWGWETWSQDMFNAFSMVDDMQNGTVHGKFSGVVKPTVGNYNDNEMADSDSFPPTAKPQLFDHLSVVMDEDFRESRDNMATHGMIHGTYVFDDDWQAYKEGVPMPSKTAVVANRLRELGVGL